MKTFNYLKNSLIIVTIIAFILYVLSSFFVWKSDMLKKELQSVQEDMQTTQEALYVSENELAITKEALQIEFQKEDELSAELEEMSAELDAASEALSILKSEEYNIAYLGEFTYTYYCDERGNPHICGSGQGITATGVPTEVGTTIAVDPTVIPLGSMVYVEGWGIRTATDTGGAVKGHKIDILLETHSSCFEQTLINGGVWIISKKTP